MFTGSLFCLMINLMNSAYVTRFSAIETSASLCVECCVLKMKWPVFGAIL